MWKALRNFLGALGEKVPLRFGNRDSKNSSMLTALCLLTEPEDRKVVVDLGLAQRWEVFFATRIEEAGRFLRESGPQVILLDRDFIEGDWRETMTGFAKSRGACVILVSKVLDDYLWNEVVSCGGYEVLPKPLRQEELARTIRLARSYWSSASRYQIK
ncbi:MAG: hypothetical protein LAO79_23885 [Acidobacteriia bacterium]|nr:hypothetical protein [Terriglobia bacterium]